MTLNFISSIYLHLINSLTTYKLYLLFIWSRTHIVLHICLYYQYLFLNISSGGEEIGQRYLVNNRSVVSQLPLALEMPGYLS